MPYKATGSTVLVKKGGKWQVFRRGKNPANAQAQAAALNANVDHHTDEGRKREKKGGK